MFCNKCVNEIVSGAKFCSKCGQAINQATNRANDGMFMLTINRANQWYAINPAVKIVVDKDAEYKIDNGATINIPISAGLHNISFSCSIRNKIVNINVANDVNLNIKWNRLTGSLEVE